MKTTGNGYCGSFACASRGVRRALTAQFGPFGYDESAKGRMNVARSRCRCPTLMSSGEIDSGVRVVGSR